MLTVTPTINNGVLDVAFGAANDIASVSVVGTKLDVFDGISHSQFPLASVQGLSAHGTSANSQILLLHSKVALAKPLIVSQLSGTVVDGAYQAPSIAVQSDSVQVKGGLLSTRAIAANGNPETAPSTGNSGDLSLSGKTIEVTPGSKLLANATGAYKAGKVALTASDSQNGENIAASAAIALKDATILGGDIAIAAASTLVATASKPLDTDKANVANLDVSAGATVTVAGMTEIIATGSVSITAAAKATATAKALAKTTSTDTTADAALAKTKVASTAIAHVADVAKVNAAGLLTISATNDANVSTTADGSLSGPKAGGASVAFATVTTDTEALVDGSAKLAAAQLNLAAGSKSVATTTAKSTAAASTQPTPATSSLLASQDALSDLGPINLAAALGITNFDGKTVASLATASPVTVAGALQVQSSASTSSSALATAGSAAPSGPPTGEGVAVAINHANATNRAFIGGPGGVTAKGISVSATTPANAPNLFDAEATSGISNKNSAVEGAAAFNIAKAADEAFLASGSSVQALSGDVQITASGDTTSKASAVPAPGANPGSNAKGMGASLAVNILADTTRAEVEDTAALAGARNLALGSTAHEALNTAAVAGGDPVANDTSYPGFAAAAGISVLNATTTSRIGSGAHTGGALKIGGSLAVDAAHKAEVANSVGGASAGFGVLGAALALDVTSSRTTATTARDLDVAGDASFVTHADLASDATAQASARGGKAGSAANAVDKGAASHIALADTLAGSAGVPGTGGATAPSASTDVGGMTVAGALAIDLVTHSESVASIGAGVDVKAGGAVTVAASNDTDATAEADGNTVTPASKGVGVGIAINADTDDFTRALIGPNAKVAAKGLTISAGMSATGDGKNTVGADATSGAGAQQTGVAGALAINVAKVTTEAVVDARSKVTLAKGDALLSADAKTSAAAKAGPGKTIGSGQDQGIGASAAFNIVEDDARAELADSASIDGANAVQLAAKTRDDLVTKAETGAQSPGGTAAAASLSVSSLNAATTARLAAGPALSAGGNVLLAANHTDTNVNVAGGTGQGAKKALGMSLGLAYVNDDTTATTDRDINAGGAVTLSARNATASDTTAVASQTGGQDRSDNGPANGATQQANAEKSTLDAKANESKLAGTTPGTSVPDVQTSNGDTLAAAGALAIDLVGKSHATASVPAGRKVNAAGPLAIIAQNDTDAHSKADGSAKGDAATGVGGAIALTLAGDVSTSATIGKDDQISAKGVSLTAGMSAANDKTNVVGADAISGASASEKAGAGAFGLSVFLPKTTASVEPNATVHAGGGDLSLSADEATASTVTAEPAKDAAKAKSIGVGLSFAFDIVEPTTTAELKDGAVVVPSSVGDVSLSASSSDTLTSRASAGAQAKGGTQSGGVGITASAAASELTAKTTARIGSGPALKATGGIALDAKHKDVIATDVGGKSAGTETAVGVSVGLSIESETTRSTTDRDLDAGGAIGFSAESATSSNVAAKASGVGGQDEQPGNSSHGAKDEADATKNTLDANAKLGASGSQGAGGSAVIPDAKNGSGKSVAVAGALAIDLPTTVDVEATIPDGRTVRAGGPLTLKALGDLDAHTAADGTAVSQASTGVGVAVALTVAPNVTTKAAIGAADKIQAKGVSLTAGMSTANDKTNVLGADATSGASATDKAGSGAFAMDLLLETTGATIGTGTAVDAGAGDLTLSANEITKSSVNALPAISQGLPGQPSERTTLGVGVAVALNIVEEDTRAELMPSVVVGNIANPSLAGAHDVILTATSREDLATTATAGASVANPSDDGTGIGSEAAISVLLDATSARVNSGGSLAASHDLDLTAAHRDTVQTVGDGYGANGGTALGIAVALTDDESQTTATLNEGVTAGNDINLIADNATSSDTRAIAGAKGGKDADPNKPGDTPDQSGQKQRDLADSYAIGSGGKPSGATPNPQAQTSGGSVAAAGALAINIVGASKAVASTADGKTINAGGHLALTAANDTDAHAGAVGAANGSASTGVGVAIALNIAPTVVTSATVGANSDVHAKGISAVAGMSSANDKANMAGADALAGTSPSEKAGVGALAMSLFFDTVEASPGVGSHLDAKGGPVTIAAVTKTEASAAATPVKNGGAGQTTGVGASIAIDVVEDTTRATLPDGTTLTNAGDLSVIAGSHDDVNSKAEAGAQASSGSSGGGTGGFNVVLADTTARIGAGSDVNAAGSVTVFAQHDGDASAVVDADAKGAKTVVGVSLAIDDEDINTTAEVRRSVAAGQAVSIDAINQSAGKATAKASASGAKGANANSAPNGVDTTTAAGRGYVNNQVTANGGKPSGASDSASAQTAQGGVSVAAAVALEIAHVHSSATIADGLKIGANGGPLTVSSWNDADSAAAADGAEVGNGNKTGIGAAVAINDVDATGLARIGNDTVNAKGLLVEATQGNGPHQEDFSARAVSGAGAKNTGIVGALALNLVTHDDHDAIIAGGAKISAGSGAVQVNAASATNDIASAKPAGSGQNPSDTGIGAGVAVNLVLKETHAEIQDGATLSNAGALGMNAVSANAVTTDARDGVQGDTAVGVSAAVVVVNDNTLAKVGTGPGFTALGDASIHAENTDLVSTAVDSTATGDATAVGLTIGVDIVHSKADATIARDVAAGGSFGLTAKNVTSSSVDTKASASGMPKAVNGVTSKNSDAATSDQVGFADLLSGLGDSSSTPSLQSSQGTANSTTTSQANSKSQTDVGVAATIAVNIEPVHVGATVAPGRTILAGGPVTIGTLADVDGSTSAIGTTFQAQGGNNSNTAVAAAVALNVATVDDIASVGAGSTIFGKGIDVSARQVSGTTDDFTSTAVAGSAGTGDAGAGSAGVNILSDVTKAVVGAGSTLNANGGAITVDAQSPVRIRNIAGGASLGLQGGVGTAIAINLVPKHDTEAIIDSGSTISATGSTTVRAVASLTPVPLGPAEPTAIAIGAAAGKGDGVGGSIVVGVVSETTHAEIRDNAKVNQGASGALTQNVAVTARDTVTLADAAGGLGVNTGGSGQGVSLLVSVLTTDTFAQIGDGAIVEAGGDVAVTADEAVDALLIGVAGAGGSNGSFGVTATVFVPNLSTAARIGSSARVTANGNVDVAATDDYHAELVGGTLSLSSSGQSFGGEIATVVLTETTEASIGHDARVAAQGRTAAMNVPTGRKDANGKPITEPAHGVAVTAVSYYDAQTFAIGGAISGSSAAVGGSAIVDIDHITTLAHVDHGAFVDATDGKPGTGPSIHVLAFSPSSLVGAAGSLAGGEGAGFGLGVDVNALTKDTEAFIDARTATADTDVIVKAESSESITSLTAAIALSSDSAAIGGAAGVQVVDVTTRAFLGASTDDGDHLVTASGNVQVASREALDLLMIAGSLSVSGGNAAVGVGAAVPVVTKTTESFVGPRTTVSALGLGNAINADTGRFAETPTAYSSLLAGLHLDKQQQRDLYDDENQKATTLDPNSRIGHDRTVAPQTRAIHGLAVTATNRDHFDVVGVNAGVSSGVAVDITGLVNVVTNATTAHVDAKAVINPADPKASAAQSVLVAAGHDFSGLGVAAGLSVSGSVAATAAATVFVVKETTLATIADGVTVAARGDIDVEAHGAEDLLTVAATISASGGVSLGGSASIVDIQDTTTASIGQAATTDALGARADAGGNVVVAASDDSDTLSIAGGLSVGGTAGVGAAVAVTLFEKTTEAYVGPHATVNAGAHSGSVDGVSDGTIHEPDGQFTTLPQFRGVAVQASSSETIVQVGAEASAGYTVGLGAAVSVEVFRSNTLAFIGQSAHVNASTPGASQAQSVSVAATNRVSDFSLGGGAGVGIVGVGGGVDIGILRNNTAGFIDSGADVQALGDINVAGLSTEDISTHAVSLSGGLAALAGSVSVWSIGAAYSSGYSVDGHSADGVDDSNQNSGQTSSNLTGTTSSTMALTGHFTGVTDGYLDTGVNPALSPAKGVGSAHQKTNSSIQANAQGDAAGSAIGATKFDSGTTAQVRDNVVLKAGRNIGVHAADHIDFRVTAGGFAVGLAAVGATVAIVNVRSHVEGTFGQHDSITAGGDVSATALLSKDEIDALIISGSGGFVSLGGQVILVHDDSTQLARIGAGTSIPKAANVVVLAAANRKVDGSTVDVQIGVGALGVSYVDLRLAGSTTALVADNVVIGQDAEHHVNGDLTVLASGNNVISGNAFAVAAGGIAGVGQRMGQSIIPAISAGIGSGVSVQTGGSILVGANSYGDARGNMLNISAGAVSATVMISTVDVSPAVQATVGVNSLLHAGGNVQVVGTHNVVPKGAAVPGARAKSQAPGGGGITGTGVAPTATANATVLTSVANGTLIVANGDVAVTSTVQNVAEAQALAASLSVLGIGVSVASATADGSASALVDARGVVGSTVRVQASGGGHANAEGLAVGGGLGTVQGAIVTADASPKLTARVGDGTHGTEVASGGDVVVSADSASDAVAKGLTASVGIAFSEGQVSSTATLDPTVSAQVNGGSKIGTVAGSIRVSASHDSGKLGATATAMAPGGGGFAVNGATPTADASAKVEARVAGGATLGAGGDVLVAATARNLASAVATADSFALLLGSGKSVATSTANGATTAAMDGAITRSKSVSIAADANDNALADGASTSIGLFGKAGVTTTATVASSTAARVGGSSASGSIVSNGPVKILAHASEAAHATSHTTAGGAVGFGLATSTATATPTVTAALGVGSSADTPSTVTIDSSLASPQGSRTAEAFAASPGGGLVAGNGAVATATAKPIIDARADTNSAINARGAVSIAGHSETTSKATTDATTAGALSFGAAVALSEASATTSAEAFGKSLIGGSLLVSSQGHDDASSQAQATAAGLLVGAAGAAATAVVHPSATALLGKPGSGGKFNVAGDVSAVANETARGDAVGGSMAASILALGLAETSSDVAPNVSAKIGASSGLTALGNLNVVATFDPAQKSATALTYATSDAGLAALAATLASATLSPVVEASVGSDVALNVVGDVAVLADSTESASAEATESGFGLVGIGGTEADVMFGGSTTAAIGAGASITAGGTFSIRAHDTEDATAHAVATNGGVVGVAGAAANAGSARTISATLDGKSVAAKAVSVKADAADHLTSLTDGTGAGLIGVGGSDSTTTADLTVIAALGDALAIKTAGNLDVAATGDSKLYATANTSAGGVSGSDSTDVTIVGGLTVEALVGHGATLHAGKIAVSADSANFAQGVADGDSVGLLGKGSQAANAELDSVTIAAIADAPAGSASTVLDGQTGVAVTAHGKDDGLVHVIGGNGGAIGAGGASAQFTVQSPQVVARIGDGATIAAPFGEIEVIASDDLSPFALAEQSGSGFISVQFAASSAQVLDESVLAELGKNIQGTAQFLKVLAFQDHVNVIGSATSHVPISAVDGGADAYSQADAYTSAVVHFGSGGAFQVGGVDAEAYFDPALVGTFSSASASVNGAPASTLSVAGSEKHSKECVLIDPVVTFSSSNPTIFAGPIGGLPQNGAGYKKVADNGTPGTQTDEACGDVNANFFLPGQQAHIAHFGADGTLLDLSGFEVVGAAGLLGPGDKITGPVSIRSLQGAAPASGLNLRVEGGVTMGHSTIQYDPSTILDIENASPYALTILGLSAPDGPEPRVVHEGDPAQMGWTYTMAALPGQSSLTVHNLGHGDIRIAGPIEAPTGRVALLADGGRITTGAIDAGGEAYRPTVSARSIRLEGASVGTPTNPIPVHMSPTAPGDAGLLEGLGRAGGFYARALSGPLRVGDVEAPSAGDVVLTAGDTQAPGDDLTLTAEGARISAPAGAITLNAGDNLAIGAGAVLQAGGAVTLRGDAGDADPGVGAIVQVDGRIAGATLSILGGNDSDAVALRQLGPDQKATIATAGGDDWVFVGSRAIALPWAAGITPPRVGGDLQGIQGDLTVDGGPATAPAGGRDHLVLDADGDAGSRVVTIGRGTVDGITGGSKSPGRPFGHRPIIYANVEALDVLLGSGDDLIRVDGIDPDTATVIDAGDGDDTFRIGAIGTPNRGVASPRLVGGLGSNILEGPDSANVWQITSRDAGVVSGPNAFQFASIGSLKGGARDDVFAIADGASLSGQVDGGGGSNTLDYSRYTGPVQVNLTSGHATGVSGGVRRIKTVLYPKKP